MWHATPPKPAQNPQHLTTWHTQSSICHCWHFKAFRNSSFNCDNSILSKMYWEHHLLLDTSINAVVCGGDRDLRWSNLIREQKIAWKQFLGGAFPWAAMIVAMQAWKQYLSSTSRLTFCTPEMSLTTGISWVNVFWCSSMNGQKIIPQWEACKLLNLLAKRFWQ